MDEKTLYACAQRLALAFPFTEHCWPFGPEYDVFKVGGKIFMIVTEFNRRAVINLKADPEKSLLNQQIYPSITPGYHMNKNTGFPSPPAMTSASHCWKNWSTIRGI